MTPDADASSPFAVTAGAETSQWYQPKVDQPVVQTPAFPPLPPPGAPLPPPAPSPSGDRSRWRTFRAFPLLGQIGIWFGVALSTLLGIGIAGAIAAGPKPEATTSATTAADTTTAPSTVPVTTTVAPDTTFAATTSPETTVVAVDPIVVPSTVAPIPMTAEIVDGDTITMSDGSTVRLIGIDTPERGQCGYDESSAVLAQLIDGQNITLVTGARDDIDKYGRLLRYVEANGVDLDLKMIESGHAIAKYDGRDGYGVHTRQDAYVQADDLSPSTNVCPEVVPVAVVPVAVVPIAVVPVAPPAAVYYQNCTEVRAAGAAPIYPGDPGWQSKFDRNGDGVGCE